MRWVCPQCRRAISFAFRECPFCQRAEKQAPVAEGSNQAAGSDIAAPGVVVRKLVPDPNLPPTAGLRSRELSLALTEGPWARGFRYGLGFALAVALVLLLLLGFWLWLSG